MNPIDSQPTENENHFIGNILAEDEDNSGIIPSPLNLSLENENDEHNIGKFNFNNFGIGSNAPYGGAFNQVPD
jgi:hypothetical protein